MIDSNTLSALHSTLLSSKDLQQTTHSILSSTPFTTHHPNTTLLASTLLKSPFYVHRLSVCFFPPTKPHFLALFNDPIQLVARTAIERLPAALLTDGELLECLAALQTRNDYLQCGAADLLRRLARRGDATVRMVRHFVRARSWRGERRSLGCFTTRCGR